MRAGGGFGMVLDAEDGVVAMAEAFERLVVQIDVRDVDLVEVERVGVDREAVIVRRDLDLLRELVAHRMVGAAMSEFQLVGFAAEGEAEQLVAEADAEDRLLADQLADVAHLGLERLGVAGAVREEDAVGLERQHIFGGGERGDDGDAAAGLHEAAQDVVLDAEIVGDDVVRGAGGRPMKSEGEQGSTGLVHS